MTQTMNGKNTKTPTPKSKQRPGQRQQERIMRLERRKRRQRISTTVIASIVVLALIIVTIWQYGRIANILHPTPTPTAHHATATPKATSTSTSAAIGPTCATASSVPSVYNTTPKAGPTNPPQVSGSPATNSDGLQCIDIKVGTGTAATSGTSVTVQYTGWLESNGKKFDSSYDRNQPFQVTLGQGQVIPGWDEGIVGMKPGGIRRLIIPAALAYGSAGQPPTIPANATLIFDIQMISD
jgi:FKBP-type peptidyl-prolyl cis-trans isomerase